MMIPTFTLALTSTVGCHVASGPGRLETLQATLQRILADSAAANGVIGAQAAVRIPGYAPWSGVTGENRPGEPMRPDLLIGTGSISKLYTAVAAMRLIDRGVLRLDDPVGRWFPDVANVDPAISLRQLLQHTSGIADYSAAGNYADEVFADRNRPWTPTELLAFIGPPLFPPGTGWNASNSNRLLLGMIVERESGESLGSFMRRELFMDSPAWLSGDGPPPAQLATQWTVDASGTRTNVNETLFSPALFTSRREVQASAADIALFGERLLAGDLLSPGLKAEMLTIIPDDGKIPGETGGGLGIRRYDFLGRVLYGHSGATFNATALFLYDPATEIVVAVSVNQNGASHGQSHFRTAPALLQAAIAFVSPPP